MVEPNFLTSATVYPVCLHLVPGCDRLFDHTLIEDLINLNRSPIHYITMYSWLRDPTKKRKLSDSMGINLMAKSLGSDIGPGSLLVLNVLRRRDVYQITLTWFVTSGSGHTDERCPSKPQPKLSECGDV